MGEGAVQSDGAVYSKGSCPGPCVGPATYTVRTAPLAVDTVTPIAVIIACCPVAFPVVLDQRHNNADCPVLITLAALK